MFVVMSKLVTHFLDMLDTDAEGSLGLIGPAVESKQLSTKGEVARVFGEHWGLSRIKSGELPRPDLLVALNAGLGSYGKSLYETVKDTLTAAQLAFLGTDY